MSSHRSSLCDRFFLSGRVAGGEGDRFILEIFSASSASILLLSAISCLYFAFFATLSAFAASKADNSAGSDVFADPDGFGETDGSGVNAKSDGSGSSAGSSRFNRNSKSTCIELSIVDVISRRYYKR